jgi:hypothetical protein
MRVLRWSRRKQLQPRWLLLALTAVVPWGASSGATGSATQSLSAVIFPAARLSVPSSAGLTAVSSKFSSFQASLAISYRVRTTSLGAGTIAVQVTSDFSPKGGPSAGGGALLYSCGGASLGTPCAGTQVAATNSQTPVLAIPAGACTGGGGACSSADPNSVTINFTLPDDPGYTTGSYSAQLTFVISSA